MSVISTRRAPDVAASSSDMGRLCLALLLTTHIFSPSRQIFLRLITLSRACLWDSLPLTQQKPVYVRWS